MQINATSESSSVWVYEQVRQAICEVWVASLHLRNLFTLKSNEDNSNLNTNIYLISIKPNQGRNKIRSEGRKIMSI